MNGVHDMGGMHGMGPIEREDNEPVFHTEWERRAFALTLAMGFYGTWNIDMGRHAREQMPPAEYLESPYYEHWIYGLEALLHDRGVITRDVLARRVAELLGYTHLDSGAMYRADGPAVEEALLLRHAGGERDLDHAQRGLEGNDACTKRGHQALAGKAVADRSLIVRVGRLETGRHRGGVSAGGSRARHLFHLRRRKASTPSL